MRLVARIWVAFAVLVALAVPTFALGQTGGGELLLSEAPGSSFPDKRFILETPQARELTAAQLSVTENGADVVGLAVQPPGTASGTVMLIDASNSMKGAPINNAMSAARAFLEVRDEDMPVAIVTFNAEQTTLSEFTTDGAALSAAVAQTPTLAEGTEIYDSLVLASEMATSAGYEQANVVLLSDGTDVGSESGRAAAIEALNDANVRVISVGLSSPQYDSDTLRSLARRTGGTYVETASPAELSAIFTDLGLQLSNEHLVTYRSLLPPETPATVKAALAGQTATATYTTPELDLQPTGSFDRSWIDGVIVSPYLMIFIIVSVLALIAFAILTAVDVRNRSLRRRMAMYVSVPSEEESQHPARRGRRRCSRRRRRVMSAAPPGGRTSSARSSSADSVSPR